MGHRITALFANQTKEGGYGDIYDSAGDCLADHPDDVVIPGFGVVDEATGSLVSGSADFYDTEADARLFINTTTIP
ncbi:hypothetical protein [Arthrobacter sp.]|uniref:hypothetical protein n=1 Tax=Arthrobacter sp. TaxID=1667 RepID=UPI003A948A5E